MSDIPRRDALASVVAAAMVARPAAAEETRTEVCDPYQPNGCRITPYELRVLAWLASPLQLSHFDLITGAALNQAVEILRGNELVHDQGVGLITLKGWRVLAGMPRDRSE